VSQPGLAPPAGPSGASGVGAGAGKSGNPTAVGSSAHPDGLEGDESKDGEDGDDPESRYAPDLHFVPLLPSAYLIVLPTAARAARMTSGVARVSEC
jgi:hypothetical protein